VGKVSKNLHNERINYDKSTLHISQAKKNPFKQFDLWYHEAAEHGGFEANAMTLSTVDTKGVPSSRVVLLKEYSNKGLVFFTNSELLEKCRSFLTKKVKHTLIQDPLKANMERCYLIKVIA
jgi:pyridoxine/pyridoxamine 5'-phosphate oxidase